MTQEYIQEQVDIYQLPVVDVTGKTDLSSQITIGDLHGNAIKLMFMLVKHGIVSNLSKHDYNRLVSIYKMDTQDLTKERLDEFNHILSKINVDNHILVRLIGDELADRGSNDYFTLKILEKLNKHKVAVEIMVSNHSIEFIEACEKQDHFHPPMLSQSAHAPSMEQLQILVDRGLVAREEILAIAEQHYKPTLKAISYSLSADKNDINIYSHAGIGLNTIRSLAQKLNVVYQDASASELALTIDSINEQFQKHVQSNSLHTLYTREKMYQGYSGYCDLSDAPFEFIMWNRLYHHIDRPAVYSGYHINFVHGHDSSDPTVNNIYNLDNALGKSQRMNRGIYTVLHSRNIELAPVLQPIETEAMNQNQAVSDELPSNVQAAETVIMDESVAEEIKPTLITLPEVHHYFKTQLEEMKRKGEELRNNGHERAADRATELYTTLTVQHDALIDKKIGINTFKNSCHIAIKVARPELEKHRGVKQVLGNLALAIIGLGVFYLIAGLINKAGTGNFLFFKTDSAKKIDQLEQSVKSIEGPK